MGIGVAVGVVALAALMGLEYWYLKRRIVQTESRIQDGMGDVQVRDEKMRPIELQTLIREDGRVKRAELHTLARPGELAA